MSQLSGNSCSIITLLPLGVDCESINASTPQTANGLISLFITGGTPPYTTTWSNGSQGPYIFNLTSGSYTATTTDYYKDFTATTICTVGYDTFPLEKFQNCANSAQTIYYLAEIPSSYITNKVYKLQGKDGCWTSKGTTLWTGETYINSVATIQAGPYQTCVECLPVTPTPETKPSQLCMEITQTGEKVGTTTYIQFNSGSTINGKESWTSVTPSLVVFYNSGTTKWEVGGWTYGGVPTQNNFITSPLGSWIVYGENNIAMKINSGVCVIKPNIFLKTKNTSCQGVSDGSVLINASSGTPPYQYSLDNVIYGPSNMFIGLNIGNYTAYVKDSNNQIASATFTIGSSSIPVEYILNISETPAPLQTNNNIGKYTQSTNTIQITATPPLPPNKVLTFDVVHSVTTKKNSGILNGNEIFPTLQYSLTTGATTGGLITGFTAPSALTNVIPLFLCPTANEYSTGSTETYKSVLSGGSASLTFTVVKKITTPDVDTARCQTYGYIRDTFQVINLALIDQNRCEFILNTGGVSFQTQRTGSVLAVANGDSIKG